MGIVYSRPRLYAPQEYGQVKAVKTWKDSLLGGNPIRTAISFEIYCQGYWAGEKAARTEKL
jgi:hypothetical protein